jgi:hypothetical protein
MPFLDEIKAKLVADAVLPAASILIGGKAVIPATGGPFISLVETGGSAGSRTHNNTGTENPTASISARAPTAQAARAALALAYTSLGSVDGLSNTTLSGTFYLRVTPRQSITDLEQDDNGRALYVFNIEAEKQPS